jgi:hypothetical protein
MSEEWGKHFLGGVFMSLMMLGVGYKLVQKICYVNFYTSKGLHVNCAYLTSCPGLFITSRANQNVLLWK